MFVCSCYFYSPRDKMTNLDASGRDGASELWWDDYAVRVGKAHPRWPVDVHGIQHTAGFLAMLSTC